jgi:thymidylate synthase (FAD)
LAAQSKTNKQGRSNEEIPEEIADKVLALLEKDARMCYQHYMEMMNQDEQGNIIDENTIGITRELARMNLTLNYYTEWYWKVNLHNLLHFLLLRADPHAQYEIRVYADKMLEIVKAWVPFTYDAFNEYRLEGNNISKKGLAVIKRLINNEQVTQETSEMTKREWDELMQLIK